jgi:hypothetical protein
MSAPDRSALVHGAGGDTLDDLEIRLFRLAVDLRAIARREEQLLSRLDDLAESVGWGYDAVAGRWGPVEGVADA